MNKSDSGGVSRRRSLFIWGLFCIAAGAIFLVYTLTSLTVGRGEFVMPLDDAYIHFQYARQLVAGQPYVYNPGLPPSSGATSFLYPYLLAFGCLLGFQGLNLGLWAMGIGALALADSLWLVYKLVRIYGGVDWLGVAIALAFGVSGPVAWHFMSGMETGLVMLFTLGTVFAVSQYFLKMQLNRQDAEGNQDRRSSVWQVIIWATLMALIRPEGAVLALLAVGVVWWQSRTPPPNPLPVYREGEQSIRFRLPLIIPFLAILVQPLVNWALTGSAVASGNTAKSVFGMIPFSWGAVIGRIASNFAQTWAEFFTGISPREGMYIMPLLLVLALIGIGFLLVRRERRLVGLMIVGWLLGGMLLIATLDTAFWHFKRYQMPFIALVFPLAGIAVSEMVAKYRVTSGKVQGIRISVVRHGFAYLIVAIMGVVAVGTAGQFLRYYALNVDYVYLQPLQMARWLQANTPPDAVVAVHDTGMMRYMGGRTTIDIVGLTTPGAADYWRNGPGSVAEYLMDKRPDYIAAYGPGHGLGLGMIADTDIYGKPLASFPVILDNNTNVALAADFQGIYKPDWAAADRAQFVRQPNLLSYLGNLTIQHNNAEPIQPAILRHMIDVADLDSENPTHYQFHNNENLPGFPTEVHELDYLNCLLDCSVVDGGRLINGEEIFTLEDVGTFAMLRSTDVILITRIQPANSGTLDIYTGCKDALSEPYWNKVSTRTIPEIPGYWLDVPTLIHVGGGCSLSVRIVPHIPGGFYMPYRHWVYEGTYHPEQISGNPVSTFQNGAIVLSKTDIAYEAESAQAKINFEWYTNGSAQGDYKLFVHVYDDMNQPPVAQWDGYPGGGTLPPGDWLPGVLRDTITVNLQGVAPGKYKVAIGLYNPYTNERLQPTGGDDQGRLFIGEIEVK